MADEKKEELAVEDKKDLASLAMELNNLGDLQGTLERPKSLDPTDRSGTEDIGADEIRLPRLAIAQGLSHQITPGDVLFIEGLTLFDMFNDLTGEIYGKGPLTFIPIKRQIRRIEFVPRDQGGGIIDMDVPRDDPRLKWTPATATEPKKPPVATTFREFIILLLRNGKQPEPIVLSIKDTNKENRRAADQLLTFIKMRPGSIYSGLYKVDTKVPAKNDKGTFGVYTIKNAGFIPKDTPAGAAIFAFAKKFHDDLEGKTIVVQREPGDEDEFDPNTIDAETAPAAGGM